MTSDFDYKKYSLEKLQDWVHDAMSSDASPHEIYSAIREAVREDYYYHKDYISRTSGLLELLSGNRPEKNDDSKKWGEWEEFYYPEEYKGSTVSSVKVDTPFGKDSSQWTYNGKPATYDEIVADGWEMTADGFWFRGVKEDKVKKWVLPVEETKDADTDETEYFVSFPDDLLEAADLKEGDQVEWVDQGDGSYILRKVTKPIGMEEC
jgi:hypothetical protein